MVSIQLAADQVDIRRVAIRLAYRKTRLSPAFLPLAKCLVRKCKDFVGQANGSSNRINLHRFMTEIGRASVWSGTSVALRTKTYFCGDVIVLRCVGRLVAAKETTAFRQGVEKLLSQRLRVVINLTEVDHIDSTGLAALVHLLTQKRDPESGARLAQVRQ